MAPGERYSGLKSTSCEMCCQRTRHGAPHYHTRPDRARYIESKAIIGAAIGASSDDVIVLGASLPRLLRALRPQRVALFVSSRETERQLAPWREFNAEIIKIAESKDGFIDLNNLEMKLQENTGTGKRMIGFFPAASKLTGVFADDVATTLLLHQYGAWSFWDYTLVAPTSNVDMNPTFLGVEEGMVRKDALFFNCEKFVGGVQGPYVAVVKKDVFKNSPVYSDDVEVLSERIEEYRCAEAVRAALVVQLRDAVGLQNIIERQDNITRQVLSHIKNIPELILLGTESPTVKRLPIFSLMVKHPRGTFLHHNFVCAVLNDVFGIQARGGLTSNLNYGADVLGIDDQLLKEYEKLLDVEAQKEVARVRKLSDAKAPDVPIYNEHLRPGFCRVSLPYFMSDTELAFVLEALKMVATEGWKILPQYVVNTETGQWRHHTCSVLRERKSLYSLRYNDGQITAHERRVSGPGIFPQTYTECLQTARNLFNRARKLAMKCSSIEPEVTFNPRIDYLRWFMLPKEAHDLLLGRSANVKHIVPFDPSGYTGARKSLNFSRSSVTSSPIFGASSRHFSLSAIDDCQIFRLKQKQKFYSRESSLKETTKEQAVTVANPVKFALGESVSPLRIVPQSAKPMLGRSRCYSLGSDSPPVQLSAQTKMNLGLKETSPSSEEKTNGFCNCGSQTDLQSLDDPMLSPGKAYPFSTQSSTSISDCSQNGRISPTTSITSHTSEDIHAYVKEMTRELATEIKSEIRGVISKVDDILENSDSLDQSNVSLNSTSSQSEKNSVSVIDVAEYLMGMSREMASEVKHEIREMVNQVDEMISPDYGSCSRRSSPPQTGRRRIGSGPELGLDLKKSTQCLRKCTTSPVLPCHVDEEESNFGKGSPNVQSPKSGQGTPSHEAIGTNNISFNSSETSTPDTIIQVVTTSHNSPVLPKSSSSNKLSDDEVCADVACRHCCNKKICCQNPSVSSQDSGINMSYTESDAYLEFVKWRTSSDPTTNKLKKLQGRLRICKHEKNEVPDIIEGVPVCSGDKRPDKSDPASGRVAFQISDDVETQNVTTSTDWKRSSRCSNASSSCSERSSRSSGYGTDQHRTSHDDVCFDRSESECVHKSCWEEEHDDSSACSDSSLTDFTTDDEGKWYCPPKHVWKATVEAIHEHKMVRAGDKVLVCLSGRRDSVALLHVMHHYQYYARAKGQHFSIGALFVHEPQSEVDPLHLMAYCRSLGVKFIYEDKLDDEETSNSSKSELHRWASVAVRRRAYVAAQAHGYSVAALAQSLDTAATAFLASALYAAKLTTTKAHYRLRDQDLRIIRPFIYVRARSLEAFACARALPDFTAPAVATPLRTQHTDNASKSPEECECETDPLSAVRQLLASHETRHPHIFNSLKTALLPLIAARTVDRESAERRHRKKSVIQMKNGAPVADSDDGSEEEPVP
ncbi:tRNA 2-thiocytidine biosynthesis protein TtcA [Papilio machaon]|uniref:tRNA 2-thiocytidine biosynthesis protein TtcA n=1 Tax=Papilio machaon TaxID=76193 RepID=A0A0N1IJA7_PAPMA|nr:tRNA 2-thiocytidine biosynthesis protein TtcA [Papilio machaon]